MTDQQYSESVLENYRQYSTEHLNISIEAATMDLRAGPAPGNPMTRHEFEEGLNAVIAHAEKVLEERR